MGFLLTNSTTKNKMTNDIIVKNSYNVDVEVKDIYYTQHMYLYPIFYTSQYSPYSPHVHTVRIGIPSHKEFRGTIPSI